jgi:hypothetical protein
MVLLVLIVAASNRELYAQPKYVGVKKCSSKTCHGGQKLGNQYGIWQKASHSKAYQTLGTDRAKKLASKAGVSGDPQKTPECLKCHVTAFGVDKGLISDKFKVEEGVQCEACHGPGSKYKSLKIMSKTKYKKNREGQHKKFLKAGGVIPTEKVCVRCHNKESPAYKKFVFEEFLKKIEHPVPGK